MERKLVYILNQYSPDEGSHFYHVLNLLEEISKKGVSIALVIEKAADAPVFGNNDIRVIAQKEKARHKRPLELFNILRELNRQGYKNIFIRISTFAALVAILVTRLYGGETYYWLSGTNFEHDRARPWGIERMRWLLKTVAPFMLVKTLVRHFVTGPESMKGYYVTAGKVKEEKITILYNDIDVKRFKPLTEAEKDRTRAELGLATDKKVLLFVHRLSPIKRPLFYLPYIIEKFYEKEDGFLTYIIGDGGERKGLEISVANVGLEDRIFILGRKPNREIHKYYQVADIFINPTYEEGFPRVLIEAMASGLPVVTTDAGGIRDIVGNRQRDFMVDREDRDLFLRKLIELAQDAGIQQTLSEENLERVKRYSTENVAGMYVERIFDGK